MSLSSFLQQSFAAQAPVGWVCRHEVAVLSREFERVLGFAPRADVLLENTESKRRVWIEFEISRADPVANHMKFAVGHLFARQLPGDSFVSMISDHVAVGRMNLGASAVILMRRLGMHTRLPLVNRILVTAQRMLPGHVIGIHSDRPFLGYEMVRLVVQLNQHWRPDHGGVLELFSSPDGQAVFRVNPEYNTAVGFPLHAGSYHGVTEVTQPRQTVVFNFWHVANTPELAEYIQALFANLHFSEFPAALNPVASSAESTLPEETTFRAGTAAIALRRLGYDEATIVTGYRHSAGLARCETGDAETDAAVLLADWMAYLYRESFDLARWKILRNNLERVERMTRLLPAWPLCLPEWSESK